MTDVLEAPAPATSTVLRMEGLRVEAASGAVLVDNVDVELARGEVLG